MENPSENRAGRPPQPANQTTDPSLDSLPDQRVEEADLVGDEPRGNKTTEKIEDRAAKKQQTHEEAKAVTGSEPHKDTRNEHAGEGPAPLDRY